QTSCAPPRTPTSHVRWATAVARCSPALGPSGTVTSRCGWDASSRANMGFPAIEPELQPEQQSVGFIPPPPKNTLWGAPAEPLVSSQAKTVSGAPDAAPGSFHVGTGTSRAHQFAGADTTSTSPGPAGVGER